MNVLFLLTPKKNVLFLTLDMDVATALDILKNVRYASVPLLDEEGHYAGTITEGDLLWTLEDNKNDPEVLTKKLKTIKRLRDYKVVRADTALDELYVVAINQNYIPIVDDRDFFIGIVTRKEILMYYNIQIQELKGLKYNSKNPGLDVLLRRRTIRLFKKDNIDEAVIDAVIRAGLAAPSTKNRRPIHIMASNNTKIFVKLSDECNAFTVLAGAPYAFFIFADTEQEDDETLLNSDAGAVTANILNALTSFNLGGAWLGTVKRQDNDEVVRKYFTVEPRYQLFTVIAFGVADETREPRKLSDSKRVHKNKW